MRVVGVVNPHSRLATCPLTGGKKPGGRESHPHHQFFREIGNSSRGFPTRVVNVSPSRAYWG